MTNSRVDEIANAVLYEGYLLYPYRQSAVKNRQRWNFGVLYPPGHGDSLMQTEVLVEHDARIRVNARVRFLHLIQRTENEQTFQEAMEREVIVDSMAGATWKLFAFPARSESDGPIQRRQEAIEGKIEIGISEIGDSLKLTIRIQNTTPVDPHNTQRDELLLRSLVSTHTILTVADGEFISLLDPPDHLRDVAGTCQNVGTWPVLAGDEGQRNTMLSSPIILYDYPQIAPESPGALFDGTEIDEILTLRVMTLTDEEKLEMSRADERTRQILERTESMPPEQFMKLHGVLRGLKTS